MANKHMKRCLSSLIIGELQTKTTDITLQPLGWLLKINLKITSALEDV